MSYWTEKELAYLRENFSKFTAGKIAEFLSRSEDSVRAQAKRLRLTVPRYSKPSEGPKSGHYWTEEELAYLRGNYGKKYAQEIADHFGRSVVGVRRKAKKMGLSSSLRHKLPPPTLSGSDHPNFRPVMKPYHCSGIFYIKTAPKARSVRYARWVWEQTNGKIPKGMNIIHKDGSWRTWK